MREPPQDLHDRGWRTDTFICPRCGARVTISLKAKNLLLRCRCGVLLSRTAQLGSTPATPEP
jgi:hypothetical protein